MYLNVFLKNRTQPVEFKGIDQVTDFLNKLKDSESTWITISNDAGQLTVKRDRIEVVQLVRGE